MVKQYAQTAQYVLWAATIKRAQMCGRQETVPDDVSENDQITLGEFKRRWIIASRKTFGSWTHSNIIHH
jgi:hypothetical protein